jgi:hypothetical protein
MTPLTLLENETNQSAAIHSFFISQKLREAGKAVTAFSKMKKSRKKRDFVSFISG